MFSFSEIVGHEQIKEHMQAAIRDKKPFHAYLFQGEEGVGKEALARTFAAGLQCQSESADKPCKECVSCRQMESGNQPDVIWVTREKASLGVDEIREQLCNTMDIKPFSSPYKIYLVPEAEKMTEAAQNALLKTIEEPPEYAVIMLLTSNVDALLPTIQSRCVRLDLKVVDDNLVKKYLMERLHVPDYQAEIDASFAQGSIGKAQEAATSEEFSKMTENALKILKYVNTMQTYELTDVLRALSDEKQHISDYLDIFQFWFRDVLMFKATREIDNLVFKQEINYIKEQASQRSYENLEKILDALEKTKVRLRANVNMELALELLFLTIREK